MIIFIRITLNCKAKNKCIVSYHRKKEMKMKEKYADKKGCDKPRQESAIIHGIKQVVANMYVYIILYICRKSVSIRQVKPSQDESGRFCCLPSP